MRKPRGEKVFSSYPDDRVVSLAEEKPKIETEKRKELTFKFEYDRSNSRFELAPLSEKQIAEKITKKQ